MLALVTGGAGFIGSHLTRQLLRSGWDVRILDDFSTGLRSNLGEVVDQCEVLRGSIQDASMVRDACSGVDTVFHLAAQVSVADSVSDPVKCEQVNTLGTVSVLTAARDRGVRRFVLSSSAAVYGNADQLPVREALPSRPLSPYAISKAAGEDYCRVFSELYGIETVALRYFNVFGPGQRIGSGYAAVIPAFIQHALQECSPIIHGDGHQSRDFVFVEDVVAANIAAAQAANVSGQVFNIGTGQGVSLLELLAYLREFTGSVLRPKHQPARTGDIRHSVADISRARLQLGYEPVHSVKAGLLRTLLSVIDHGRSTLRCAA